ncbi:MAG: nuclease, partial [Chloroflexota bacterium]
HALANQALSNEISGVTIWHINADEASLIDYDMSYKKDAQDLIYAPDAYRSSDHDPVYIGMNVCDEIAPTLEISLTPNNLWPANHKYVDVTATVVATDNFDPNPTVVLLSVTSSEADEGLGDGDFPDDIVILDEYTFQIRAERSGKDGEGRTYTFTYQVTDACGNVTIESATVLVPFSQKK